MNSFLLFSSLKIKTKVTILRDTISAREQKFCGICDFGLPDHFWQWCRNPGGMGGYIPPIIWLYPPNRLRMVHFCIPPKNLKGCTAERKFGEKKCSSLAKDFFFGLHLKSGRKSVLFLEKTFFFWSSPKIGEKKCSIFGENLFFFGLHLKSGRKSILFLEKTFFFFLVFI